MLETHPLREIPAETKKVAQAAFPNGSLVMKMRDELGRLYTDEQFQDLFPERGEPAESPGLLAFVVVLQFAEGLTDRQAADAVRAFELRKTRYLGLAKTHLQGVALAAGINLHRFYDYLCGTGLGPVKRSPFVALVG